ncbi:MAG: hypothetical protein HYV15_08180 [Elusimicrobia bacterium]|nr:hypothetical protein [Elusimicrobiota bacterium]
MHRSIFSPCTAGERAANFEEYWAKLLERSGDLLEGERDLAKKKARLAHYRENPVRSRRPLPDPGAFHRNSARLTDDPAKVEPVALLLANIFRFAYHEWSAVTVGWDATVPLARARTVQERITRLHCCEEICHGRLFMEMMRTFRLEGLEWPPVDPATARAYRVIPRLPEALLSQAALIAELLGVVFYRHVDSLFDDLLQHEPESRERVRGLLDDIMADELSHIGLRRNFLGPLGVRLTPRLVAPLCGFFFGEMLGNMPKGRRPMDNALMVEQALAFHYEGLRPALLARAWVPS